MAGYRGYFKLSVEKDLRQIPRDDIKKIVKRIGELGQNPRPDGSEKLTDQERYRIRQGQYRILYSVDDSERSVWVVKVSHRRDVYKAK